jgi:hypothetical protein
MDSLASQIATGLLRSFNGKFGSTNVNTGITAPGKITAIRKGTVAASIQPMCGSVIDTNYTSTIIAGDTTKFASEKFNFIYTCSTNYLDGYKVTDNVENRQTGTGFYNDSTFSENLTVKANKTYTLDSISGSSSVYSYKGKNAPVANIRTGATIASQSYSFTDTQVEFSTGTARFRGTANYHIIITDINGKNVIYTGMLLFTADRIDIYIDDPSYYTASNGEIYELMLSTGKIRFLKYF